MSVGSLGAVGRLGLTPGTGVRGVITPPVEYPTLTGEFFRFDAGAAENTYVDVSQAFAPSAVDTTNHKLTLPDLGFAAFSTYASCSGTPVYFTTTGVLPPEIADPSKQYFLSPAAGGGYDIYCEPDADDWVTNPYALQDDVMYPGQNFSQRVNKVTFSSQGSGTHTVRTKADRLISALAGLVSGKSLNVSSPGAPDKQRMMEQFTDPQGRKHLRSQRIAKWLSAENAVYNNFGKTQAQGGGGDGKAEASGKRSILSTFVLYADMTDERSVTRLVCVPARVNTTTGVISSSGGSVIHGFVTGCITKLKLTTGSALPAPFVSGTTYYARAVSTSTFTLHPTKADADANTNVIIPTDQGTGEFLVWQPGVPADPERMRFVIEHVQPNGSQNVLTPRYNGSAPGDTTSRFSSDWTLSGSNNGEFGIGGRSPGPSGDGAAFYVWIPSGAIPPVCADTGLPLTSGVYYISLRPSSGAVCRLHRTYAQAMAAVGRATSGLTNAEVIKYVAGEVNGACRFETVTRPWSVGVVGNDIPVMSFTPPQRQVGVLSILGDYNDPDASLVRVKQWWNGVLVSDDQISGTTKGLTGSGTGVGWTLMNSPASHVAWEGRLYWGAMQASTGAIAEAEVLALHAWAKDHFAIA